jgi:hypothetical protein
MGFSPDNFFFYQRNLIQFMTLVHDQVSQRGLEKRAKLSETRELGLMWILS